MTVDAEGFIIVGPRKRKAVTDLLLSSRTPSGS